MQLKLLSWTILFIITTSLTISLRSSIDSVSLANNQTQTELLQTLITRNQALLLQDEQMLIKKAAGRLDSILDPIFTVYHKRIPDFATWAFQWRTSYSLLRRGALTAITLPLSDTPELQRFSEVWDEFIIEKFDELVLRPEGGDLALRTAHNNWEIEIYAELKATITDIFLTTALLQGQDLALWAWQPIAIENKNTTSANTQLLAKAVNSVTTSIKVHAVRPLLTRIILRPPIAATVTVAGEYISGYGDFGFFGTITGFAATIAGFLSVDYLISRVDAAISQQHLEIEVHRALDQEHERLRQEWLNHVEENIKIQMKRAKEIVETML
jgi:hypothetical protein